MTPLLVLARCAPAQAWRNGGGQTRELFRWPAAGAWRVRISRADIEADGPFSAFPGVSRWFAVLQGAGVALTLNGEQRMLHAGDAALPFDGALAPECRLLDGPTQDLNLMAVGGDACMARVVPGVAWRPQWQMRGLYTTAAGRWRSAEAHCPVPADTLLWQSQSGTGGDWHFTPELATGGNAWWLGFTP